MGFLDTLVATALPILGTALGGPAGGLLGGAVAQQINRPPQGGIAGRPTFAAPPSQEPPSFLAQLGTALVPVAGQLLRQELTPDVPTTLIADPQGLLGPRTTTGTFTTAQRTAQVAAAREAAGLPPLTTGLFRTVLPGVQQGGLGAAAVGVARLAMRAAANPLIGSSIGTAAGIAGLRAVEAVAGTEILGGPAVTVAPIGQRILRGELTPAQAVAGNAGTFRQTVVQTVSRATGQVVRQETFRGAPFLMQHDIVVAKKVFRMAQKLHGRLPRRQVKRKAIDCPPINQFIQDRVLSHALQGPK